MPTVSIYSVLTFWDADCPSPKLIHSCLIGIEVVCGLLLIHALVLGLTIDS